MPSPANTFDASRVHAKMRAKFKPFRPKGTTKNFLPHVEDILFQMFPSVPHQLMKALRDRGWVDFSSIFNNMGAPNKLLDAFLVQHNHELLHHHCFLQLVFFSRHIQSLPTDTPDVTSAEARSTWLSHTFHAQFVETIGANVETPPQVFKNIEYQMQVFNSLAWDHFASLTGHAIREHLHTWLNCKEPPSVLTFTHPETQTTVSPLQGDPADLLPGLPKTNRRIPRKKHGKAQLPESPLSFPSPPIVQHQTEPAALLPPKASNNQAENKRTESLIQSPEPCDFSWVNLSCQQKIPKVAVITTNGGEMIDCLSRKEVKRWQKQVKKAGKELLEAMESQAEQQDPEDEDPDSQEAEDQSVESLTDSLIEELSNGLVTQFDACLCSPENSGEEITSGESPRSLESHDSVHPGETDSKDLCHSTDSGELNHSMDSGEEAILQKLDSNERANKIQPSMETEEHEENELRECSKKEQEHDKLHNCSEEEQEDDHFHDCLEEDDNFHDCMEEEENQEQQQKPQEKGINKDAPEDAARASATAHRRKPHKDSSWEQLERAGNSGETKARDKTDADVFKLREIEKSVSVLPTLPPFHLMSANQTVFRGDFQIVNWKSHEIDIPSPQLKGKPFASEFDSED